jgi:hypothetical protein
MTFLEALIYLVCGAVGLTVVLSAAMAMVVIFFASNLPLERRETPQEATRGEQGC